MAIHPTAIIDPGAEIHPEAEIGPFCIVGPKVKIGRSTELTSNVRIDCTARIGEENLFHPGCVIGGIPQDKKYRGEESWTEIGDRNQFRECFTAHRGTEGGGGVTRIGNDGMFMAYSHIAHDCIIGNSVILANSVQLGGHVHVEDNVGLGGLAACHHFVTVGRFAFIAGMSRVVADAPPFMITDGIPSRVRAVNRVGLTRGGFSDEDLGWLKEAYRLLFFEGLKRDEAQARLEERGVPSDLVWELLRFIGRAEHGKRGRAEQP